MSRVSSRSCSGGRSRRATTVRSTRTDPASARLFAAFAEAVEGNRVVRRHVVQVGRADRPSPMLTTHITTVNLNPTWTVPLGILNGVDYIIAAGK